MSRLALGVFATAALGLVVLGLTSVRVAERGRFAMAYSTYGAGPDGTMGLYQLLEDEGWNVSRWAEDLGRLPPGGVLVVLGGCDAHGTRSLSRAEREHLGEWVRAGGVLLVAGPGGFVDDSMGIALRARGLETCRTTTPGALTWAAELADEDPDAGPLPAPEAPIGVAPPSGKDPNWVPDDAALAELGEALDEPLEDEPAWTMALGEAVRGLPPVPMRRAGMIEVLAYDRTEVLLTAGGKDAAAAARVGDGVVIALVSASMLQNRDLATGNGAALFLRLLSHYAPGAPVRFDEYHVGAGERRSMMRYFGQLGVVPLLLQVIAVLGLVLVARGRRFGGTREASAEPVSATRAFVHALAGLFGGSKDLAGAHALLQKDAVTRIARFHHANEREATALAAALEARGRSSAAAAVRTIAEIAAPKTENDVAARVRAIDEALARALDRS